MEWNENLILVDLNRESLKRLRRIYESSIDVLLISYVNWTYLLVLVYGSSTVVPQETFFD